VISHAALIAALSSPQDARYWAIRWQYLRGDGFFDELLRAAAHADPDNLARLHFAFPEVACAVYAWKNIPGWAQATEAWAESLVTNTAPCNAKGEGINPGADRSEGTPHSDGEQGEAHS